MTRTRIDIRKLDEDAVIEEIQFSNGVECSMDREDLAHFICIGKEGTHSEYIFVEGKDAYVSVRRSEVGDLIKALEYAKTIWENVR